MTRRGGHDTVDAIILAGGKGTRLQSVVSDVPKPMAGIGGRPFLDYLLTWLSRGAVERAILSIGYMGDTIRARYGEKFGALDISYSAEDEPLGTGGAIKHALKLCQDNNVFVINGDTFFDINLTALRERHDNSSADITVAVKEMYDFDRYGTVVMDNGVIVSFHEKKPARRGFINGGVYVIKSKILDKLNMPDKFSFENDILHRAALRIGGVPFDGGFIDIGIPEDYAAAQELVPRWAAL